MTLNGAYAPSWNLLALLLSSIKDFDTATKVCDLGWKGCIGALLKERSGGGKKEDGARGSTPDSEVGFTWDSVDCEEKEDLFK